MSERPEYVFTRDYVDNNRINLQHYLWIELFGYAIHPDIVQDKPKLRIADVGTGTAIWLTDLSRKLPSDVSLEGLDISFDATPPPDWLPSNISFHHWNVRDDVPQNLIGVYDIVHIRNFAFVLQDAEIPGVLQKLFQMIKPGGYLQWAEPDMTSFRIISTKPTNKITALTQLLKLSQGQDTRLAPKWVPRLPETFTAANFQKVVKDVKDADPPLALAGHECNLVIHQLVASKTKNEEVATGLKKLLPEVAEETRQGSMWAFTRWTVIGQKPL